jgi:hypothetical protein
VRQDRGLELASGSLPRPRRPADGPPSCGAQQDGRLQAAEIRTSPSRPCKKVEGAAGVRPPSLRWLRPPRLRLSAEAPIEGEVVVLGVDAERTTGGGAKRCPTTFAVITHSRWRAPDVHVSLVTAGGHDPTPTVVEAGGSAPEQAGECVIVTEVVVRSRAAPELAGLKHASPEQGSSDLLVKKARVRSKM